MFVLDHEADVPLGVQIDWAIRAAITAGRLRPGDRLPALRDLAAELGVNHNTLRAAVAKLERGGLLESRHGAGTFVAAGAAGHTRQAPLVDEVVRLAADAGLSPRALAAALYVADEPAQTDPAAEERRALRDEIAVLDRLLVELEAKLPHHVPPEPQRTSPGRILTTAELREERDAVVRRIATVQRVIDGERDDEPRGPAAKPRPAPKRAGGLAPGRVRPAHGT